MPHMSNLNWIFLYTMIFFIMLTMYSNMKPQSQKKVMNAKDQNKMLHISWQW